MLSVFAISSRYVSMCATSSRRSRQREQPSSVPRRIETVRTRPCSGPKSTDQDNNRCHLSFDRLNSGAGLFQVDAPVHIIEGETHTNAGKFYQVACPVVVLSPEVAFTPVYLDSLVLAADQHVLLH